MMNNSFFFFIIIIFFVLILYINQRKNTFNDKNIPIIKKKRKYAYQHQELVKKDKILYKDLIHGEEDQNRDLTNEKKNQNKDLTNGEEDQNRDLIHEDKKNRDLTNEDKKNKDLTNEKKNQNKDLIHENKKNKDLTNEDKLSLIDTPSNKVGFINKEDAIVETNYVPSWLWKIYQQFPKNHHNKISIYILDSGIDPQCQEVNIEETLSFLPNDNGFDRIEHGCHLASILGSRKNDVGTKGIIPKISIHSLKVINNQGQVNTNSFLEALKLIIQKHSNDQQLIVNIGFNITFQVEPSLYDIFHQMKELGIIVCIPLVDTKLYNLLHDEVIFITTNNIDLPDIILCPIDTIISPYTRRGIYKITGGEIASTIVCGICSLYLIHYPDLKIKKIKKLIRKFLC